MSHKKGKKKFKKGLGKYSTFLHKWLGLVIGIQVVLWVAGGFVMSYFPIEEVRGEHNIAEVTPIAFDADYPLAPVSFVLAQVTEPVIEVKLKTLVTLPVYEVTYATGKIDLFHAVTPKKLTPLPAEAALVIAEADFAGTATPGAAQWLTEHNLEYRGELPVWRIDMNDAEGTHLYVSPQTGRVVAHRNDVWRLYDFFWMLHIMDYKNRTNFNNPLVIWASVFALIFSLTGIIMLFFRFKKKDFGLAGNGRKV